MKSFIDVKENYDLSKCTTLGIGGVCKYLVKPTSEEELIKLIEYVNKNSIKYIILGNGSNVIIDDTYFDGIVIKLDHLNKIEIKENSIIVQSGVMLPYLVNTLLKKGITTLSFASMIPGNIGGSIIGNAGAYNDDIFSYIKTVKVLDKEGIVHVLSKNDIEYSYRHTNLKDKYIVTEAEFIIQKDDVEEIKKTIDERNKKRQASQPLDKKNVGSIFKNPEGYSAGKLIDDLNLKSFTIGGAKVSEKHANFIVNENNATFKDIIDLINYIKSKVKENYNIDLEVEPNIIKWDEL